jgi:hypothetical protein
LDIDVVKALALNARALHLYGARGFVPRPLPEADDPSSPTSITTGNAAITTSAQARWSPAPIQDLRDTPRREHLPSRGVAFFAR